MQCLPRGALKPKQVAGGTTVQTKRDMACDRFLKNVAFYSYGGGELLCPISRSRLHRDRSIFLTGPCRLCKTTLMKLCLVLLPTAGHVSLLTRTSAQCERDYTLR